MTEDECVAVFIERFRNSISINETKEIIRDAIAYGRSNKPTLPPEPPPGFVRVQFFVGIHSGGGYSFGHDEAYLLNRGWKKVYALEADIPIPHPPETIVAQVVEVLGDK